MNKRKNFKPITSVFDDSFFNASRFENESFEVYKQRQKSNKQFMKMYQRFGRERFIAFMQFMKQMGEQEILQESAE